MSICLSDYALVILYFIILIVAFAIYRKKDTEIKFIPIAVIILYTMLLLQVTMFPIWIYSKEEIARIHEKYGEYIKYYQVIPFNTIKYTLTSLSAFIRQDLGNIILLFPIPIIIGFIKKHFQVKKTIVFGVLVSITIELLQLLINVITKYPAHVCDVDDLILNSIGVVIGVAFFLIIRKINPLYDLIRSVCRK